MSQVIPLQAVPSQQISVTLANQNCRIDVEQKSTGLFVDLYVNDELVIGGVIAENRNRIVRDEYLGFSGDLLFVDQNGDEDPEYTGLADRFTFMYLTADEVAAVGG